MNTLADLIARFTRSHVTILCSTNSIPVYSDTAELSRQLRVFTAEDQLREVSFTGLFVSYENRIGLAAESLASTSGTPITGNIPDFSGLEAGSVSWLGDSEVMPAYMILDEVLPSDALLLHGYQSVASAYDGIPENLPCLAKFVYVILQLLYKETASDHIVALQNDSRVHSLFTSRTQECRHEKV